MHIESTNRTTNFKSYMKITGGLIKLPNGKSEQIIDAKTMANLTQALVIRLNKATRTIEADTIAKIAPDFKLDKIAASTFVGDTFGDTHPERFLMFAADARNAKINGEFYGKGKISEGAREASIAATTTGQVSKIIKNADGDTLSLRLLAEKKGSKIILTGIEIINDNAPTIKKGNDIPIPPKEPADGLPLFPDLKPDPKIYYGNE